MSYLVSQGTRDIGIRAALGATRRNILGMVLRQGTALAAAGLAIGLAGAWTLARFMQSLLIGVSGTDRLTFIAVPAPCRCRDRGRSHPGCVRGAHRPDRRTSAE